GVEATEPLRRKRYVKRGKMLGGIAPRRGGKLTSPTRDKSPLPDASTHLLLAVVGAFFVLGIVGGFIYGLDRQLRSGLMAQREEARQRPDWIALEQLPGDVARASVLVSDPQFTDQGTAFRSNRASLPR